MDDIIGKTPIENFVLILKHENDKMFDELQSLKCKVAQLETNQHIPNSGRIIIYGNLVTCHCCLLIDTEIPDFLDKLAQKLVIDGLNFESLIGTQEPQNDFKRIIIRFDNNVNMGPFLKSLEDNQEIPFLWIAYKTFKDIGDFINCQHSILNLNQQIKSYYCSDDGALLTEHH